jgi:26S proteasome regulatory subunit N9
MENEKIASFLESARDNAPDELQHYFLSFEDFWERKLWHELTDILIQFYRENASKAQRIEVYDGFVKGFADKINQLKLVMIGLQAAGEFKGGLRVRTH